MRRRAPALLLALAALVAGCGGPARPRPIAAFPALQLTRPVPALARLTRADLRKVEIPDKDFPGATSMPADPAEVIGSMARTALASGTFLLDEHLDRHPLAPAPVAAALEPGQLGLALGYEGAGPVEPGDRVEAPGSPLFVVAAAGPAGARPRPLLVAAPAADVLAWIANDPPWPPRLAVTARAPAPGPPGTSFPGRDTRPRKVVVARAAVRAGEVVLHRHVEVRELPRHLLPPRPLENPGSVLGKATMTPLFPGEVPTWSRILPPLEPEEAVTVEIPFLAPDWLHLGGDALLLRPGPGAHPLPITVVDILRSAPGDPGRLRMRPMPGWRWRDASPPRRGRETGRRRWLLLHARDVPGVAARRFR